MRALFAMIVAIGLFAGLVAGRLQAPQADTGHSIMVNDGAGASQAAASDAGPSNDGSLELQRNPDGHFYADVQINGATVHMLVDTGATLIALSRDDARYADVATSIGMPGVIGRGADGDVHGEVVRLDRVELGGKTAEKMPAVVLNGGAQSLLGQSFLKQFKSVSIKGDKMILR